MRLPSDTQTLRGILDLADEYADVDIDFSYTVSREALDRARAVGTPRSLAAAQELVAMNAGNLMLADTAAKYFAQALDFYEAIDDTAGVASLYYQIGNNDLMSGGYGAAIASLQAAIKLYRGMSDRFGEGLVLSTLADVFLTLQRPEESLQNALRALRISTEVGDTLVMIRAGSLVAVSYNELGRPSEALLQARQSEALAEAYGVALFRYEVASDLVTLLVDAGRFREALLTFDEYTALAQDVFGERYPDVGTVAAAAEAYRGLGRYREAVELLRFGLVLSKDRDGNYEGQLIYQALATTFAALNRPDSAYHYARLESAAKDSLYAERNADALSELETRYQTAEKESEIERQSAELSAQRRNLYLTIGGLGLALAGVGVVGYLALKLRRRNAEREVLIKEVHHRVKNNLQTLSSLLYLQGRHIDDEAAAEAMRASQARVEAMGLIHRRLYTTDHLTGVAVAEYVPELAETLVDAYGADARVRVETDIQPLVLDVDTAIPLGLILNELITNSLKYAFPAGATGTLTVSLREVDAELVLRVSDDGAGTDAVVGAGQSTGFGGELVGMLSQKLKGRLEVENTAGGYATTVYVGAYEVVGRGEAMGA